MDLVIDSDAAVTVLLHEISEHCCCGDTPWIPRRSTQDPNQSLPPKETSMSLPRTDATIIQARGTTASIGNNDGRRPRKGKRRRIKRAHSKKRHVEDVVFGQTESALKATSINA